MLGQTPVLSEADSKSKPPLEPPDQLLNLVFDIWGWSDLESRLNSPPCQLGATRLVHHEKRY